jgi:hypothetical protein
MNLLVPLASLLGLEVNSLLDQLKRSAAANLAIALFGLIAFTFLLVAGYVALSDVFGPVVAALMIAAGSLLIALGIYFALWVAKDQRKRRTAERRHSTETTALVTTAALTALPLVFKSSMARNIGLPLIALLTIALSSSGRDKDDKKD